MSESRILGLFCGHHSSRIWLYTGIRRSGIIIPVRDIAVGCSVQIGWLESKAGQALLQQECALARSVLERVFGDQIVQIGTWGPAGMLLEGARTQASLILAAAEGEGGHALSLPERVAIRTDSVDAVMLPHTLELAEDPYGVLREVFRILRPDGRLIVFGMNPFSWWGARHLVSGGGYPDGLVRQISRRRMSDWLQLLNLRIDSARACYVSEPRNRFMRVFQKSQLFANAYMLAATKETIPATVVRPRLGRRAALVRGLVNPTTRNVA